MHFIPVKSSGSANSLMMSSACFICSITDNNEDPVESARSMSESIEIVLFVICLFGSTGFLRENLSLVVLFLKKFNV